MLIADLSEFLAQIVRNFILRFKPDIETNFDFIDNFQYEEINAALIRGIMASFPSIKIFKIPLNHWATSSHCEIIQEIVKFKELEEMEISCVNTTRFFLQKFKEQSNVQKTLVKLRLKFKLTKQFRLMDVCEIVFSTKFEKLEAFEIMNSLINMKTIDKISSGKLKIVASFRNVLLKLENHCLC